VAQQQCLAWRPKSYCIEAALPLLLCATVSSACNWTAATLISMKPSSQQSLMLVYTWRRQSCRQPAAPHTSSPSPQPGWLPGLLGPTPSTCCCQGCRCVQERCILAAPDPHDQHIMCANAECWCCACLCPVGPSVLLWQLLQATAASVEACHGCWMCSDVHTWICRASQVEPQAGAAHSALALPSLHVHRWHMQCIMYLCVC
jgi:hypothetical protein